MEETTNKVTHKAEWSLCNFKKKAQTKFVGEQLIVSENFIISLQDMTFKCYVSAKIKNRLMSLFLHLEVPHKSDDLYVKYKFWIPREEKEARCRGFAPLSNFVNCAHETHKFLDITELLVNPTKYLDNDNTLIIAFKVKIFQKAPEVYLNDFSDFFNSYKLSDVVFICSNDQKVYAHKVILSARSKVMREMFDREEPGFCREVIQVNDIEGCVMREILRFVYTGNIEPIVIGSFASKMLYGAIKYKLNELKNICVSVMIQSLSVDNVVEYLILSEKYNEDYLLKKCAKFIKPKYNQMRQHHSWIKVNGKLLQILLDIFERNAVHFHYLNIAKQ